MDSLPHISSDADTFVVRCAWLVNPGAEPRPNVRVSVCDGKIAEVCDVPADEFSDIASVALLPQFVNAHTHLEFSALSAPVPPPQPFTDWIQSVIGYRGRSVADADFPASSIRQGWSEVFAAGTSVIGEITTSDSGLAELVQSAADSGEPNVVSFREVLGFTADRISSQLQIAARHLQPPVLNEPDSVIRGLSPHAPYSVHPDLFAATVDLALKHDCPIAMHLAETQEELQFLAEQSGPFVDLLSSLNLWDSRIVSPGTSAMTYLEQLAKVPRALAVHCNYLSGDDVIWLGQHPGVAVVYCPRTHAWFGHAEHPWQKVQAAGGTVVLGTDSRASNPDLSIWRELQFVARQTSASVCDLLPMITTTAASALGLPPQNHVLAEGSRFSAVAVPCRCDSVPKLDQDLRSQAAVPKPVPQ